MGEGAGVGACKIEANKELEVEKLRNGFEKEKLELARRNT